MGWLDRWDIVLLAVAAYVAVMALVRLMTRRRDEDIADVQQQLKTHRRQSKNRSGDRNAA
jgi:predicted exporter